VRIIALVRIPLLSIPVLLRSFMEEREKEVKKAIPLWVIRGRRR
jgi:hypothetical protein